MSSTIEFTPIVYKGMRFIMSKTPNNKNIDTYISVKYILFIYLFIYLFIFIFI